MKLKIFEKFDYLLMICVLFLGVLGILFLYSAGVNSDGVLESFEYKRQIIWVSIGFSLMCLLAMLDYRKYERYALAGYVAMIVILLYVRLFGKTVKGAKSWIGIGGLGIQPSEFCKVLFIMYLARYLKRSSKEQPLVRFLRAAILMFVPVGLILLQPDLGTSSVFIPVFLFMCFMANIPLRYIVIIIVAGFLTVILTVLPAYQEKILKRSVRFITIISNTKFRILMVFCTAIITIIGALGQIIFKKRYYYWISIIFGVLMVSLVLATMAGKVLKQYQMMRLIIFMDPYCDPRDSGWNIIQSMTAIGSGGFWGQGFLDGIQSHRGFLPEQKTDFIFSIMSEESGFIGGMLLFAAFFIIMVRIIHVLKTTTNTYGFFISAGILGMIFFHFIVNVGMVMGIMPITGIPLPFLSYGGSALITNMAAMGILMSINSRRLDFTVTAT